MIRIRMLKMILTMITTVRSIMSLLAPMMITIHHRLPHQIAVVTLHLVITMMAIPMLTKIIVTVITTITIIITIQTMVITPTLQVIINYTTEAYIILQD